MLTQFTIRDFRCFADLPLKQLGRVNLIAGKNNTGKTALLEAIHLHNNPSDWHLPSEINKLRGIHDPMSDLEEVCGWLFRNRNAEGEVHLESVDAQGITRSLVMTILDATTSRERYPDVEKTFNQGGFERLILKYKEQDEPERVSIGFAGGTPGGSSSTWMSARIPWKMPSVFLSSNVAGSPKDIQFFGELERAKRQDEILPALRILEPRLQKLSLIHLAGESVIHGDIGLPRLVPVPFMGEGMRRVLSIVLAIANAPRGIVLVDEIENGLHYSIIKEVWQAIGMAARRVDAQVFATTHSYECIVAAHQAFIGNDSYDLRLFRLDRINDEIRVAAYDREILDYAAQMNHEVR